MCAVDAVTTSVEDAKPPGSEMVSVVRHVCLPELTTQKGDELSFIAKKGLLQEENKFAVAASIISEAPHLPETGANSSLPEVTACTPSTAQDAAHRNESALPHSKACAGSSRMSEQRADAPPAPVVELSASGQAHEKPAQGSRSSNIAQRCKLAASSAQNSECRMDGRQDVADRTGANSTPAAPAAKPDITVLASAVAASKLGLVDQLSQALATCAAVAFAKDAEDRTCLHYAAGYGHEECVSLLLEHHSDTRVRDANGDVPLHFAAIHGHPMCAYNITKACPATCLTRNYRGQTPVEVAVACERGEVLNAMLLACAGDGSGGLTVQAMRKLLASGAVPDTWAPNGSSALMLAAAANGTEALAVLLEAGATLELQDALGRSALMFAAGNCARDTLLALLDAGASISQRDRRGRNVLDYAPPGSEVRRLLQARLDELEAVANKLQEDLLASLGASEAAGGAGGVAGGGVEAKGTSGGKKKKQSAGKKAPAAASASATKSSSSSAATTATGSKSKPTCTTTPATASASDTNPAPSDPPSSASASTAPVSETPQGLEAATTTVAEGVAKLLRSGAAGAATIATTSSQNLQSTRNHWFGAASAASEDNDERTWQKVNSHKCSGKSRQQQLQPQPQSSTSSSTTAVLTVTVSRAALTKAAAAVAASPAPLPPQSVGRPPSSSSSTVADAAATVHLAVPPVAVACGATTTGAAAAAAAAAAQGERRPAWGGVKPGSQVAAAAAVSCVAGCSPRSYPPLAAAASAGTAAAPSQPAQPGGPQGPSRASSARQQQAEQPHAARQQDQEQQASLSALISDGSESSSSSCTAAASAPPSVASLPESEVSSSTGTSTCSHSGDGSCSPRSLPCHYQHQLPHGGHHDWTRPSPVDVLLQAALAASADAAAADAGAGVATGSSSKTLAVSAGHRSSGCSSSSSSCKIGSCGSSSSDQLSCDSTVLEPLQPLPQQPTLHPYGIAHLGGTEVPPPRRSGGGGPGLSTLDELLGRRGGGGTAGCFTVGSPSQLACGGGLATGVAAAAAVPGLAFSCAAAAAAREGGSNTVLPLQHCLLHPQQQQQSGAAAGLVVAGAADRGSRQAGGSCASAMSDVARLRSENEALQRRLRKAELRHSQEVAAVLMDAEQHEAAAVERAVAQERLRITANLLAIGLCPEAILAVITPPGHGLDARHILAASTAAAAAPPALGASALGSHSSAAAGGAGAGGVKHAAGAGKVASGGAGPAAAVGLSSSSSSATAGTSGRAGAAAAVAAPCRNSDGGSGGGRCGRVDGSEPPHRSSAGGGGATSAFTSYRAPWDAEAAARCSSDGTADALGGICLPPSLSFGSLIAPPSPAIAIPSAATAAGGGCCPSAAALPATAMPVPASSNPGAGARLTSFGSPSTGRMMSGSFGSNGVMGGVCAGLGLGVLSGCGGCGFAGASGLALGGLAAVVAAEEGEEEDDGCAMDLPACGDISALLAMSDDDDA